MFIAVQPGPALVIVIALFGCCESLFVATWQLLVWCWGYRDRHTRQRWDRDDGRVLRGNAGREPLPRPFDKLRANPSPSDGEGALRSKGVR